ncbi:MAG: outer membrane lipoprotein carrier protein LolA [Planctomycetia bacterium]|nr:outer membrane lipoprotein carrier protein LolA [Planctomycetia bacterium]
MKSQVAKPLWTIALVLFCAGQVRAETIEDVKQKIHAKVSSYKSLEYRAIFTIDVNMPQMSMKSTTEQTAQYVNNGDKILGRLETTSKSEQKMGDQASKTESKTVDISDGQFAYTVSETDGTKSASKRKADLTKELSPFNAQASFKLMEEQFTIKLLPDETVDGKAAWVLEMKAKDPAQSALVGRTLSYYDKESGISVKSMSFDPSGKPTTTSMTKDIKINSTINPDRFVFKAPPGVNVVDTTVPGK